MAYADLQLVKVAEALPGGAKLTSKVRRLVGYTRGTVAPPYAVLDALARRCGCKVEDILSMGNVRLYPAPPLDPIEDEPSETP